MARRQPGRDQAVKKPKKPRRTRLERQLEKGRREWAAGVRRQAEELLIYLTWSAAPLGMGPPTKELRVSLLRLPALLDAHLDGDLEEGKS